MGDFSFAHLILLVIVGILVYGKDLPQAARKLAIVYNKLRRQIADIKDEIGRQIPMDEIKNEINKLDVTNDLASLNVEIPMPPTSVMGQVTDATKVIVTWNSVPGATTYALKRSTSASDPLLTVAAGLTDLSYADTGLEPGKTYHYVVTAQNSAGESGSSEEAVVTLAAEIPGAPPVESAPLSTPAPPPESASQTPTAPVPGAPAPGAPANGSSPGNALPEESAANAQEPPRS